MVRQRHIPVKELTPEARRKRRLNDAQRKRKQMALQRNESIGDTQQRRRYALQKRQEGVLINLSKRYEQRKEEISKNQELRMKALRKAGKLTQQTDTRNTQRHLDQKLRLQNKYIKDRQGKLLHHKTQIQNQRDKQKLKNPTTDPFTIDRVSFRFSKKFNHYFDTYRITVNYRPVEPVDVFVKILNEVVKERGLVNGDYLRLTVDHRNRRKPFSIKRFRITNESNFATIIHDFLEFVEYKEAPLSELIVEVHSFKVPKGMGRLQPTKENMKSKISVVTIKNTDSICGARAVVTAVANINLNDVWTKRQIKNGFNASGKLQAVEARKLHDETDVPINEFGNTLDDFDVFARHLNIQISIIDGDRFNELIYTTSNENFDGMIYLLKSNNHFDVIKSMTGFLAKDYFCHNCKKTYAHADKHRCAGKCIACYSDGKCEGLRIECPDCFRTFYGKECFDEHKRIRSMKKNAKTVCDTVQKCQACRRTHTEIGTHICGHKECVNCKEMVEFSTHKCYMKKVYSKGGNCLKQPTCKDSEGNPDKTAVKKCYRCSTRKTKYMVYDFETTQDTGEHIVNYVHAWDFNGDEFTFQTIEEFCKFAFSTRYENYTFIAHNAKGFDNQFILGYCVEQGLKPYTIMNGSKIMFMKVGKVTFLDSMNHVAGRLADFPKTFGFEEMKKGYFPHLFNTPENQKYIGPIPDTKHFNPDRMSPKDRTAFLLWHRTQVTNNFVFDFEKELKAYCRSDVDILRRSMMSFREKFITISNIDPLLYVTIAAVSMAIMRSEFLMPKQIAVVKSTDAEEKYDELSIAWLDFETEKEGVEIQHALNGGEFETPVGKVDGFCRSTNTVYEFQGCFWHGCPDCQGATTINPKNKIDMAELREQTLSKNLKLQNLGYNFVEVYKCKLSNEFKKWDKNNPREFIGPLDPRDAFFGGRTNVTNLDREIGECERGRYVDFVSLYPTVQFNKEYPVGHPIRIEEPDFFDTEWFGFVKCKVEAPRGLYHPVLPVKMKCGPSKKLLFALCRTCSENQQQETCEHNSVERSFIGTWTTNELLKAIEKGYVVHEIYEVLHFEETTTEMFKGYVSKFMKIKMESSKMNFDSKKSETEFRKNVKDRLDIDLEKIEFNPGMRAIAKLCLNSLWGKFGQRVNMTQTRYVTKLKEFYRILLNDTYENLGVLFLNDDMVQMTYTIKDQFVDNYYNTNIYIAAFTTSHARVMLYDVLDKVGDAAVGYDTDSVFYVEHVDRPFKLQIGDSLGDLTDELEKGEYIEKWTATGPKSYSFRTNFGREVCKVKGFTLNYANGQKINHDTMTDLVKGKISNIITKDENAMTRNVLTKKVVNKDQHKTLMCNYNKRVVLENFDTRPYGY